MPESIPPDNGSLLALCAVLRWFYHELLVALGGYTGPEIETLLTSELVIPSIERPATFCLREASRQEILLRLRAERTADELLLHTRSFEYFRGQLPETLTVEQRDLYETECLYHLDKLFFLLAARKEWNITIAHVTSLRNIDLKQPRHRHLLMFYEGAIANSLSRYDQAEHLFGRLLAQPDLGNDIRLRVLNALAQAQFSQTHYDRALDLFQQVATLAGLNGDQFYEAAALINMGMVYNDLAYYARAIDLTKQSLDIFRALHDDYRVAYALYELGNSSLQLGRWEAATTYVREAADLCEAHGWYARLAYSCWCEGLLHHILGDEGASELAYRRGLGIAADPEYNDQQLVIDLLWYLGLLYTTQERWAEALESYDRALELASALRRTHWVSLILYQRGKLLQQTGRLDEALVAYRHAIENIEALRSDTEGEELKFGLLGSTQQIYEAMVLLCLEQGRKTDAFHYVERARSRAFLDMLTRKAPDLYATIDQPVVTLDDVQATLPADALLIEYFTTGVVPRGEHLLNQLPTTNVRLRSQLLLPPRVIIFAVTHDRFEVHQTPLDPNTLRPLPSDPAPGRRFLWRERLLVELHQRLIEPCQALLHGRELLYLIPHGPLHYVPFMALRGGTGQHLLDADSPAIAFAPSATVLLRSCLARRIQAGAGFLALGYNDVGDDTLRYAELEADLLAQLMQGEAWIGADAKRGSLREAAGRVRWLHFAGHAVYHPEDPLASELRLGDGATLTARTIISELQVRADLVTLSACTSGLSHILSGDELLGLPRALLYAGAPAVVCTLWETNDLVALLVMEHFYAGLRDGQTPVAALRDAQVAIREMTNRDLALVVARWRDQLPDHAAALAGVPHITSEQDDTRPFAAPFHWAPFMLVGRAS